MQGQYNYRKPTTWKKSLNLIHVSNGKQAYWQCTAFRAAGLLIYNFVLYFFFGGGVNFYGSLQPYWCMVKFPTVFLSETILYSKKM